jgi:deazaflavin-dependent oxidoreductase (nitroreductase family)
MTEDAQRAWEDALIADIREHDGRPTSGPLAGHPLLLMYSTGARSGERRRAVLTYSRDGDAYIVTGSASGSPRDPAWISNVKAHPDVTVEIGQDVFEATASVVDGPEQERLWDRHVAALPWFADYPEQAHRTIPVVRLTRRRD